MEFLMYIVGIASGWVLTCGYYFFKMRRANITTTFWEYEKGTDKIIKQTVVTVSNEKTEIKE